MLGEQELANKTNVNFKIIKTVGLISDTHIPNQARYIPKKIFEIFEKVDFIIHAGDLCELAVIDELEQVAPVLAVKGNMDGGVAADTLPMLNILKVFDWKIGVMHNPNILEGFSRMRELVRENTFNVFVYGHTHASNITWEASTLYINPGSPIDPDYPHKPSVGLLRISKEAITPQLIEF